MSIALVQKVAELERRIAELEKRLAEAMQRSTLRLKVKNENG